MLDKLEKKEITLLGLQFLGIIALFFSEKLFLPLFVANILLLVFSVLWIYDTKFNLEEIKKNWLFILMPLLYFVSTIFFMNSIKNIVLQVLLLGAYVISNYFLIRHIDFIRIEKEESPTSSRNIVNMILLLMVFLTTVDLLNAYIFYKLPLILFLVLVFISVSFITYFLFLQYKILERKSMIHIFFSAFAVTEIIWLGSFWLVNYPASKIGELGIPVLAVISVVSYYTFWGISHHKLTNTLTKKVLTEYIMISVVLILIILFTTKWIPEGVLS